jgi:hypothetical protein
MLNWTNKNSAVYTGFPQRSCIRWTMQVMHSWYCERWAITRSAQWHTVNTDLTSWPRKSTSRVNLTVFVCYLPRVFVCSTNDVVLIESIEYRFYCVQPTGVLKVTGYLRSQCLDVNGLVHLPGWGDFQMTQVDVLADPNTLDTRKSKPRKAQVSFTYGLCVPKCHLS